MKISQLNELLENITIRGHLTKKSELIEKRNRKYFGFKIKDTDNLEMDGICFSEACDKFYPMLNVRQAYEFQNVGVSLIKNSSRSSSIIYKVVLKDDSEVFLTNDEEMSVNSEPIIYTPFKSLHTKTRGAFVNIRGVIKSVDFKHSELKDGRVFKNAFFTDKNNNKMLVKFWNDRARELKYKEGDKLNVQAARVYKYNNETFVSVQYDSPIEVVPKSA